MRVLLSCITYHPTVGGADDFARSIAEGLARRGHDVAVATSDLERHVAGVRLRDTRDLVLGGVPVYRHRSYGVPGHCYPLWPGLAERIRRFRPDVIHAFGLGYYSVDGPSRMRVRHPVLVSPTGGRWREGRLYGFLRAAFGRHAERVPLWTALSRSERSSLRRDHPDAPAIEILSPSIDEEEWRIERPDPFSEIPRGRRILFAGRLSRDKGLDDLCAALRSLRAGTGAELLVAGPDYGYGEPPRVEGLHRLGVLPRETLLAAYQHCDVLVLPSYHEGFGIVLIEAMAAGKPVVAYDNTSMPELARDGQNGRCVPTGDVEALTEALRHLLDHPAEARAMGENGKRIARSEFGRGGMLDRVESLYRRVVADHRP